MALTDLLKHNITSFDIETTGTFEQDFRVTQVGFHQEGPGINTTSREFAIKGSWRKRTSVSELIQEELDFLDDFNKNLPPGSKPLTQQHLLQLPNKELLLEAHKAAGAAAFGQRQYDSGALDTIVEAFRNNIAVDHQGKLVFKDGVGTLLDASETLKGLLEQSPSIVLIQNVNFEHNVYSKILKQNNPAGHGQGLTQAYATGFNQAVYGTAGGGTMFRMSSRIVGERRSFRQAATALKSAYRSNDTPKVQDALQELQKARMSLQKTIVDTIEDSIANGKSTVIDLMDLTDVFQASLLDSRAQAILAQQGLKYEPLFLQRGRSIELLAQVLLGETETHTALSDAQQQTRILSKILHMTDEVQNGVLSQDTINYINALNDPKTHQRDFLKTMHSQLTDVQIKASQMDKAGKSPKEISDYIAQEVQKRTARVIKQYDGLPEGNLNRQAVADSINTYFANSSSDVNPLAQFSTSSNSTKAQSLLSNQTKINNTLTSLFDLRDAVDNQTLLSPMTPPTQIANTAKLVTNPPPVTSNIPPIAKYGLLGLGAMVLLDVLAPEQKKKESQGQSSYHRLYTNHYAGTAYADWKERNQAHNMGW